MHNNTNYLPRLVSLISLWTMSGILLHDVQLDMAAITALSPSSENRKINNAAIRPNVHVHPEDPTQQNGKGPQPRVQPKRSDGRANANNRKTPKDTYSIKPPKKALK